MAENGNTMAMREACQKTLDLLMQHGNGKCRCVLTWDEFNDTQKMLRAAISAPTEQPMNCAAMREALFDVVMLTMKVGLSIRVDVACGIIAHKAKRAVAATPRNCDRFNDELDAQLEFLNEVWLISVDKDTMLERDRFENWTDEMRLRYAKWLMAPAKKREGETDGSK